MATAPVKPRVKRTLPVKPDRKRAPKPETRAALNMRIQLDLRDLIDRAAEVAGKNRTDFVLDAARQAAQTTLLDQAHVQLTSKALRSLPTAPRCADEAKRVFA